jgi:hypothetical protein
VRRSLDLALIVAISAAANLIYFVCSGGDYFYPDSFTYLAPAKMLLAGHGFASRPGLPEALRTPAYPLLLAALGTRVVPVIVLQHLLNAALAAAIYLVTLRRLGSRFVAMTAALLFAIDPPTVHYANKLLTETMFTALLFVVFVLGGKAKAPLLHGLLTGVLVLTRPVAIVYFVVVAIFFAIRRVPRRTIAIYVVAALALPLAWATRNRIVAGNFTISTIGATNLLLHRAAGAMAIADEGDFKQDLAIEQRDLLAEAHDVIEQKEHVAAAEDLPEAVRAPYYSALARRVILQHPIAFAVLTLRGLVVNVFDSDWEAIMMISRLESRMIELSIDAFVAVVFLLAVAGVIVLWRTDRALAMLIAGTVAYFLLISAGSEAEARFRVPVVPQMAIAAACGLEALRRGASPAPR